MGIAVDSLFSVMMSWVRALVSALWALLSGDRTTALAFLSKNWMVIAAVMIVCGLVIDWLVWLIRWQPYHLWARRLRRLLRLDEPDEEEPEETGRAHAAAIPEKRYMRPQEVEETWAQDQDAYDEEDDFYEDEDEEQAILMEARARAEAEQADRLRREQEAYEAERLRREREAYEAEQARLAQEEYARQMEEYERQKAQYERELAEYERQKAAYEAQLAAQEMTAAASSLRRRRTAAENENEELEMTRVQKPVNRIEKQAKKTAAKHPAADRKPERRMEKKDEAKHDKGDGLLGRMAKMIEPEEEELITRKSLPPRVDMNDAFRTAKLPVITPPRDGRRRKG